MAVISHVGQNDGVARWRIGDSRRQRAPVPEGPEVEIVIGADRGLPVGVLEVTVPVGGAMPEHDHGASATLLVPLAGSLRLIEAGDVGRATELEPGTLATIPIGCRVRLENAGDQEARMLAVLTPPDFAGQLEGWPAAEGAGTRG
jgi:quercetin dioxygenase-like cupin family protein